MKRIYLVVSCFLYFSKFLFCGSITYDKESNIINVVGFSLDAPCTLEKILEEDKKNNWGIISYDKKRRLSRFLCLIYQCLSIP